VVLFGYTVDEVKLPALPPVKLSLVIEKRTKFMRKEILRDNMVRQPVAVSAGGLIIPAVPYHADHHNELNQMAGAMKRYGNMPPPVDIVLLERLRSFVQKYIHKHYLPLDPGTDFSVEHWLSLTNYPAWKKESLLKTYNRRCQNISSWDKSVSGFIKSEFYPEAKNPRFINARQDAFKALVGPYLKQIELVVFNDPRFIKKVPICDRAQYIFERLYRPDSVYTITDYTSFEASFLKIIMEVIQFELYRYMLSRVPNGPFIIKLLEDVLGGINSITTSMFDILVAACRMSGEMDTSLGNGFTNLMLYLFACDELGILEEFIRIVIEGDDGLSSLPSNVTGPTSAFFARLGFVIKLEVVSELNKASFCGLVFDLTDRSMITDPRKYLCTFSWISPMYKRAKPNKKKRILRSKALSMLYQFPKCPILTQLSLLVLRLTSGYPMDKFYFLRTGDAWRHRIFVEALDYFKHHRRSGVTDIGFGTRLLMEEMYGISIEYQLALEQSIERCSMEGLFNHPLLRDFIDPAWFENFDKYTRNYLVDFEVLSYPIRVATISKNPMKVVFNPP
jgi:hypothetical protein